MNLPKYWNPTCLNIHVVTHTRMNFLKNYNWIDYFLQILGYLTIENNHLYSIHFNNVHTLNAMAMYILPKGEFF